MTENSQDETKVLYIYICSFSRIYTLDGRTRTHSSSRAMTLYKRFNQIMPI
jgi:hypothetical protein